MVPLAKVLRTHILAVIVFIAVFVGLCILDRYVAITSILAERFHDVAQPLIGLSVSLIIFPFITVPAVENIVSKARELRISVNLRLLEDYINGCFTVFLLALTEIIVIIIYSLLPSWVLLCVAFSVLGSLAVVLGILVLSLWQVMELLYRVVQQR